MNRYGIVSSYKDTSVRIMQVFCFIYISEIAKFGPLL